MSAVLPIPEPDSEWRNIKKGTIYKVWMIATDVDCPSQSQFVVYQLKTFTKIEATLFTVSCSESSKIGKVCNTLLTPDQWFLHWRSDIASSPIAWARPLELWHEKFELIS